MAQGAKSSPTRTRHGGTAPPCPRATRGGFYGYKLHAVVCTATDLPIAWHVAAANEAENTFVEWLLDVTKARGFTPETCAMDKGYDASRIYAECEAQRIHPVIPLRAPSKGQHPLPAFPPDGSRHAPYIRRDSKRFSALYRARTAVEREFGRLKHEYGLAPLRVRGQERVSLHADLCILGRLAQALARVRERAIPLAA